MRKYWDSYEYYEQPSNEQLKRNAKATISKQQAKGKKLEPVIIEGRAITKSWWGNAWCTNLERYADYESRLSRGKRYVRNGSVIDLNIERGKILARVQGTRKTPYKVEIKISPLSQMRCQAIIERCETRLESLQELLLGNFPESMKDLFLEENGLFPTPTEISFNCSCPDWALMCKHVAATLYGVGARLDENPALFFELRGIDMNKFIDVTLANSVEQMLSNVDKPSSRILSDDIDLAQLFGDLS